MFRYYHINYTANFLTTLIHSTRTPHTKITKTSSWLTHPCSPLAWWVNLIISLVGTSTALAPHQHHQPVDISVFLSSNLAQTWRLVTLMTLASFPFCWSYGSTLEYLWSCYDLYTLDNPLIPDGFNKLIFILIRQIHILA